jgi:hypothetical protein
MKRWPARPKLQETNGENDGWEHQKRQNGETKPMELLNESIETVERNQWNRWTNSMDSFTKTGAFAY